MRKENKLVERDRIRVSVWAPKEFCLLVKAHTGTISKSVNARELELKGPGKKRAGKGWRIEKWDVQVKVEKV